MKDRKGVEIKPGQRARFKCARGWYVGWVRMVEVPHWSDTPEVLVDNGAPGNADLPTNGFRQAAWCSSKEIEVMSPEVLPNVATH